MPSSEPTQSMAKRLLDITLSSFMLLFVFPLMVLFAVLVKLDSDGPVFYRQLRVGVNARSRARRQRLSRRAAARPTIDESLDGQRAPTDRRTSNLYGRPFPVLKFRTMRTDAEKNGAQWCAENDPRVTRVGAFLRKSHLDELPQLINVLRGDMSLVGPRPERPEFVVNLTKEIPSYSTRLSVRPGLTGLAQIRHHADVMLTDVKRKIRYDILYMRRASLSTDLKIIFGTVPLVLGMSMYSYRWTKKARRFLLAAPARRFRPAVLALRLGAKAESRRREKEPVA